MMTAELTALALAGLLQVAVFAAAAVQSHREIGTDWLASPRDLPQPAELSLRAARLKRAYENGREWLPLFALAVLVITLGGRSSGFTAACAWLFLAARLLYIPAYVLGLVPGRSVIWATGFLATVAMLVAAIL